MSSDKLELRFENISCKVKEIGQKSYKTVLRNLNGCFRNGELTAIMGPSGAGKTTLLNILIGVSYTRNVNGQVLINGAERNIKQFRQHSRYIMQESELFPLLTVMESMYAAAGFKLPLDTTHQDKINTIMSILLSLGLDECLNIKAGNLSGGERKRLFIAQELLSDPAIIFLDEPTSGLDTVSANQCINVLKKLSGNGKMIVITVHQPSAFILEKFDHLYFLSQGQCFYQGPVHQLIPYLKTFGLNCPKYHNPADYVTEVASLDYGDEIVQNLIANVHNNVKRKNDGEHFSNLKYQLVRRWAFKEFINEVKILLKRSALLILRDLIRTYLVTILYAFSGFFLGLLYYGRGIYADDFFENYLLLQVTALFIIYGGVMNSVTFFPLEYVIFEREYINGYYKLSSYFLAKMLIDLPTQVFNTLIFSITVYVMTSQPMEISRFTGLYFFGLLASLISNIVGILIGIIFGLKNGPFVASAVMLVAVLTSGSILPFKDTGSWVYWISHINFLRYLHQGIEQSDIFISSFSVAIIYIFKIFLTYFVLKLKVRRIK